MLATRQVLTSDETFADTAFSRRTLLAAIPALGMVSLLGGCERDPLSTYRAGEGLSAQSLSIVTRVADIILPATDTAGAVKAGVPAFIDRMVRDWMTPDEATRFVAGLARFDADAGAGAGSTFSRLKPEAQVAAISKMDAAAYPVPAGAPVPFIVVLKGLIVGGYYTTEIGATQELMLNLYGGAYVACGSPGADERTNSILPSLSLPGFA